MTLIEESNLSNEDLVTQSLLEKYRETLALLAENDGFKIYQQIIRSQVQLRKDEVSSMLVYDNETMAKRNLVVGEISGLETAMLIPERAAKSVALNREMDKVINNKENDNGK